MNHEQIIRMAREAELYEDGQFFVCKHDELERFAILVAEAEREANIRAVRAVQAAYDKKLDGGPTVEGSVCSDCIGAIRARGNT